MAHLEGVVDRKINSNLLTDTSMVPGEIVSYNAQNQTVDIKVRRMGRGDKTYNGVAYPSSGRGVQLGAPNVGDPVMLGFVGNSELLPVVLSILSGDGTSPSPDGSTSIVSRIGKLLMGGFFR